jgi:heme/copper-type cytochrome/quinol oxidase subunit 2
MQNKENRKQKKENRFILKWTLVLFSLFYPLFSYSQCAMCRAALESSENNAQAEALNDGIVFLMVIPYVLVALVAFAVYKIKYAKK